MDMTKEQPQPSGTTQTTLAETPPGTDKRLGRRGLFGAILSRFTGDTLPREQTSDNNQGVNQSVPVSENKDPKLGLGRRDFLAAAGAAAAVFAINPEKAQAQLGGVGPDGAPPPDVSDPNTPLPDNRSPEAREAREAYLLPIEFLHDYKGKDPGREDQARETFKKLFGIASEVSRAVPALQTMNTYMAKPDDPNKNLDNGYHLVQGLGAGNKDGAVRIGVVAFNPGVDMGLVGINQKIPLTIARKVETYKKIDSADKKVLLTHLFVIGDPDPNIMNPDNIGLIVQSVLYPYNRMLADKRFVEQAISEMKANGGEVDIEMLKKDLSTTTSELNTNARIEAWRNTLEPLDDILSSGNWRVDPDLARFHEGYKALRPQEGDPSEVRDNKLKDLRDYLGRGPN